MPDDFCHLHVHTIYSILDGINRLDELAKHVKEHGMSSCAITDHGALHGVIEFYKEAESAGIKPIIGVEAYLTEDEDGIEDNKDKTRDNFHCILLAQNAIGLSNLYWLTNRANLHNFYYRPRIAISHLKNGRADGIIATSSCLGGVTASAASYREIDPETNRLRKANPAFDEGNKTFDGSVSSPKQPSSSASANLGLFAEIFQGRFYAEIQDNPHIWQQQAYNQWLVKEAKNQRIPTIITADAHFLSKPDKATHDLIMAQQMKCTLDQYQADEDGMSYGDGHYLRTPDEMHQAAIAYGSEEAFWNTMEVSKACNVKLTLGEYKSPTFDITQEDDYEDFKKWQTTRAECSNGS